MSTISNEPAEFREIRIRTVMHYLEFWGIGIRLDGNGSLLASPKHPLTEDDKRVIRRFKPIIVEHLAYLEAVEATARNILGLTDAERAELRQELDDTDLDDPNLAFDREAYARAIQLQREIESTQESENAA